MCNFYTTLAQASGSRTVAQCEHGILHLSWDIATLHMRADDFLTLDRFLFRCCGRTRIERATEGWCKLERDEHSNARLWIGPFGMIFAESDLTTFAGLVRQAAKALLTATAQAQENAMSCPPLLLDNIMTPALN